MTKASVIYLMALVVLTACSNCEEVSRQRDNRQADSVVYALMQDRNLDKVLAAVDSLEQAGSIDGRHADYLRARSSDMCWQVGLARYYYSKVFMSYSKPIENWDGYVDAGYRLSVMRKEQHDYEGALGVSTQLIMEAEQEPRFPKIMHAFLFTNVADCQLELLQYDEARRNYLKGYNIMKQLVDEADGKSNQGNLLFMTTGVCGAYLEMEDTTEASIWLQRTEEALADYISEGGDAALIEEYKGHIGIAKASFEFMKGNTAKANAIFNAIPDNQIQVPRSVSEASKFLIHAGRYADAVNRFAWLDSLYNKDGYQMSFSQITDDMVPRFEAMLKTGKDKEALELAEKICQAIVTAVDNNYRDNSQELSVLFGLHEHELAENKEIYEKEIWRIVALAAVCLSILFCVGFWQYHKQRRKLMVKSYKLANALWRQKRKKKSRTVAEETPELLSSGIEEEQPSDQLSKKNKRAEFLQNMYFRLCDILDQEKTFTNPDLKREDLASMLGTNYKYVGDAIRECTSGMSINEFLNMKRLEYATHLLIHTNKSIIEISDASGFNNRTYFNRLFREYYKMTPSEYRKAQ